MGAKVKTVQPGSQATPFAMDFLQMLQGAMSQGAFGTGVGPMQRESGTALRQYLNSGANRLPTDLAALIGRDIAPGGGPVRGIDMTMLEPKFDFTKTVRDLEGISKRRTQESAADLRESFGMGGSRFGTPLALAEGRMRNDAEQNLTAQIGQLAQATDAADLARAGLNLQGQQAGVNRDLSVANMMLQDIFGRGQFALNAQQANNASTIGGYESLFNMGTSALAPLMQMALAGILPQEIVASPNPWLQLGMGLLQGASSVAGAAAA